MKTLIKTLIIKAYTTPRLFAIGLGLFAIVLPLVAMAVGNVWSLRPCELCLWQRGLWFGVGLCCLRAWYPNNIAFEPMLWLFVAELLLVANAMVAFYHVGLEQSWWSGGCAADWTPETIEELKASLKAASPTSCSEATWHFWGISMAGWNGIIATIAAIKTGVMLVCSKR